MTGQSKTNLPIREQQQLRDNNECVPDTVHGPLEGEGAHTEDAQHAVRKAGRKPEDLDE